MHLQTANVSIHNVVFNSALVQDSYGKNLGFSTSSSKHKKVFFHVLPKEVNISVH